MNKLFAPFLPPWAETGLQPAFYDLESGTVLQQTARMYDKVNQLIRLFNELSEETQTTVEEYIAKFIELKDFVDDYFENLDVQEEINNKLDAMVEDGTLLELILPYISGKNKFILMPVSSDIDTSTASGDCSVIKTVTGKVIMIDTGATHSYSLIKQELDANNITKIDYLIISHFHGDHTANIINLDNDFDFSGAKFYLPKHTDAPSDITPNSETEVLQVATLNNCEVIRPDNGDDFEVDDIKVTFFNCSADDYTYYASQSASLNDYSMVCYVECGQNKIAFTGDLGKLGQQRCYDEGYLSKCNIVKVPHHGLIYGSGNSSDFNITLNPEYCLASVSNAYLNSVSLTGSECDIVFQANGSKMFATYEDAINVFFNETEYNVFAKNELYTKFNRSSSATNIYVDATYTGDSDGTSLKPYKSLNPALAFAQKQINTLVKINVVGTYNSNDEIRIFHSNSEIEIAGDITVQSLSITDSRVKFDDTVTVTGTTALVVLISKSIAAFNTLILNGDTTASTVGNGRGMSVTDESKVSVTTLTISNKSLAFVVYNHADLRVTTLSGTGNTYGYVANGHARLFVGSRNQDFATTMEYKSGYVSANPKSTDVQWTVSSRERLTSGADLNDIKVAGQYMSVSGSITNSLVNAPTGIHYAFNMTVEDLNGVNNIMQTIRSGNINNAGTGIWVRVYDDSGQVWSDWLAVVEYTA